MERLGTRAARWQARGGIEATSAPHRRIPRLALATLALTLICGCENGDGPGFEPFGGSGGDGTGSGGGGGGYGSGGGGGIDDLNPPELSYEEGELVGRFRIAAPEAQTFVLRGTLPVPPGTLPMADGRMAFAVRDPQGTSVPAQLEAVSRYATPDHGADVVEVLARVQRPGSATPGSPLVYDVVFSPHEPAAFQATAQMDVLVQEGVYLEVRDVFGHLYQADLMRDLREGTSDLRILRNGAAANQVRTHEILLPQTPVAGASGTLVHHVAAHAYITRWQTDEVVSLDLRVYNGGSGVDPDDPLDDPNAEVYFDELVLRIPSGWHVLAAFADPFLGPSTLSGNFSRVPVVRQLAGGKLHMMPMQAQLLRRLILYRDGYETAARAIVEEQTLAFCTDDTSPEGKRLASWWNPLTGRYFSQKEPLPRLDGLNLGQIETTTESWFNSLYERITTGAGGVGQSPVLGWAHPFGTEYGFMHGGDQITYFPGTDVAFLASISGYRSYQIMHRMYTSRHATSLFDADGEPTRLEDWLQPGGPTGQWNPTWVWIKPMLWLGDPFGFSTAPSFQVDAVAAMGKKPDYEDALLAFQHIFDSHLVRYLRSPKVLSWLGNDAVAKDDLRMQAELVRLTWSDYPNAIDGNSIATGMPLVKKHVDQFPGEGAQVSRRQGWHIDTVVSAYALAPPAWRSQVEPWCDAMVDLLEKVQDVCTGVLGIHPDQNNVGGTYRLRQSISEAILENALWGLRKTVYGDRRPEMSARLGNILIKSGYAMVSDFIWNAEGPNVHFYTALGPYDVNLPPFCTYVPPGGHAGTDNYQGWPTLAYAYRLTGDGLFLTRAVQMAQGNLESVPSWGGGYLENISPVLALFQELGM